MKFAIGCSFTLQINCLPLSNFRSVKMLEKAHNVMIVAGEASGDLHAAKLVRAFGDVAPDDRFEFFGSAGEHMREAGVEAVVRADDLSIVGLLEIGRAFPMFLRTFSKLRREAIERRPSVVILVDFPDFNLKLAKALHGRGAKIVYYVSPQLWAWRQYRIRTIRKYVDLVISILPFEKDWYASRGVGHVEYVGSPLAREVHPSGEKDEFCRRRGLNPDRPIVALLPGSRHKEIVRVLPVMLETASLMSEKDPSVQFVVAVGSEKNARDVEAVTEGSSHQPPALSVVCGETFDVINAADVAAVTSGTATLEAGIIGTPMAIVYKTSALNYGLLRPLIDVEFFGLVNMIAGEAVARELIQRDFTADKLAVEIWRLLEPKVNAELREQLRRATDKLGHGGASRRAAEAILRLIEDVH